MNIKWNPPSAWWKRAQFTLLDDWESPGGRTIPHGFTSDGVTVPFFFRVLISPTGQVFPAAVVHDFYIITSSWSYAYDVFKDELEYINVSQFKKRCLLAVVKLWGIIRGVVKRDT